MKKETTSKSIWILSITIIVVAFLIVVFMPKSVSDSNSYSSKYTIDEVLQSNDLSKCKSLGDKSLKESCELKLTVCTQGDDDCFYDKSRFEMDERMCYNILDENKKIECTSAIRISSIKQRAVIEDSVEICNEFGEVSMIQFCSDNYYYAKRFNENNLGFCEKIMNEVIKNECFKTN